MDKLKCNKEILSRKSFHKKKETSKIGEFMAMQSETGACENNIKYDFYIEIDIYIYKMKCYHNFHAFKFKIFVANV